MITSDDKSYSYDLHLNEKGNKLLVKQIHWSLFFMRLIRVIHVFSYVDARSITT